MPTESEVSTIDAQTPNATVEFTLEFKRSLRTLAKSYRSIRSDIEPLIEQLKQGETPGDRIPRVGYSVYKVRILNSDIQKGKSGGYRVIYYLQTAKSVILVTVYSKLEQGDIAVEMIQQAIEEYERLE